MTPFRKVIDSESPSDALNWKEDEMSKNVSTQSGLPVVHARAAGIDIGSRFHVVAVAPNLTDEPVQTFQAFTADLVRMADALKPVASG